MNKYCIILLIAVLCFSCKEDVPLDGARLSPISLVMLEGSDPQQIYLYLYPSYTTQPEVRWVSDNEEIAAVSSDGMVTPVAPGKTRIRVFSDNTYFASCAITVMPFIHVTSVSLDQDNISCQLGNATELKLKAAVLPEDASNPAVTWSSNAPDIVSVDALGNLTALSTGSAIITATTVDGDLTASCTVTVTYEYVTGITVTPSEMKMYLGVTRMLTANVIPANASNPEVTWSSENPAIVQVDNTGAVTAVAAGTTTVTATTVDGGFKKSCTITVSDAEPGKGPNLLGNPDFEDPDDGDESANSLAGFWSQVPADWYGAYYGAGNAGNAAGNAQRSGITFFETGNGAPIADILTGKYTGRLPAATTAGVYQLIDLTEADTYYWVSVNIAFRKTNVNNQSVKTNEAIKVLSADGKTTYGTIPVKGEELLIQTVTGYVFIPAGVTQIRFQIDQRTFAVPQAAPLCCFDECEFRRLIE